MKFLLALLLFFFLYNFVLCGGFSFDVLNLFFVSILKIDFIKIINSFFLVLRVVRFHFVCMFVELLYGKKKNETEINCHFLMPE